MSDAFSDKISSADPAPLGLAGFAFTTFVLSFVNSGLFNTGTSASLGTLVIPLAIFWGGVGQLIAGIFEMRRGSVFGYTAFCSYGAFWLFYAFLILFLGSSGANGGQLLTPGADFEGAVGITLILWGVFTLYMWIPAMHLNLALNLVFLTLWITFFLLGAGNLMANDSIIHLGGYLGIVCAALAAYTSFAVVTNSVVEHKLPLGPAIKILG
jgi:hypothetical protein